MLNPIEGKYFWYVSKDDIGLYISDFMLELGKQRIKKNNLREIDVDFKKIVCREAELKEIEDSIFGKEEYCRVCGSLVLYGYGGVGKTALAVEFLQDVYRRAIDDPKVGEIDFLLFFSSKEEKLKTYNRTGDYYIDKTSQQVFDFKSFKERLFTELDVVEITEISEKYKRGIVVVDNIENFDDTEKDKLFDFIRKTPRQIQYIITSRNEEPCEGKLPISEFKDLESGTRFLREYIYWNDVNVDLSENQLQDILNYSKGNTLILVLCLSSLEYNTKSFDEVIGELSSARSHGLGTIADFMYKNTFEDAITNLEKKGYHPKDIINTIYLFDEDADLFSISVITKLPVPEVDEVCKFLTKKLVLDKVGELYRLNDFAGSFIFVKMLPDPIEVSKLVDKIKTHKSNLKKQITSLDETIKRNKSISLIMNDWKPRNYIDRILIAEAFNLFRIIVGLKAKKQSTEIMRKLDDFEKRAEFTNHPYVNFQKARMYAETLNYIKGKERDDLINRISRFYEDAIENVYYSYPFIKNTISHGALLMFYGNFLGKVKGDSSRAIRFLEDSLKIFRQKPNKNIYTAMDMLSKNYKKMYEKTNDDAYRHKILAFVREIKREAQMIRKNYNFDSNKFLSNFSKFDRLN